MVAPSHFGPSGVRALPLAAGINEGGHYFGPSGVRALPLAAGINVGDFNLFWSERSACASGQHLGGHYFAYINLLVRAECVCCPWLLA